MTRLMTVAVLVSTLGLAAAAQAGTAVYGRQSGGPSARVAVKVERSERAYALTGVEAAAPRQERANVTWSNSRSGHIARSAGR